MMNILRQYFGLTSSQEQQFEALQEIFSYWNARINVISRQDMENLYERHILHSLGIAKVIKFNDHTSVLDVGTGGGFPGIPLAIMFPSSNFLLVDSIGKKITVVNAVVEKLGLTNVRAVQSRAENIEGKFDFVVSRAVTALPDFFSWVKDKIKGDGFNELPNGVLYLKGGDVAKELAQLKNNNPKLKITSQVFELSSFFKGEFFETKKVVYFTKY